MKQLVVLISGGGSNLQAILDACDNGSIQGRVAAVISNRPNVMGLQRAVKAGADAITLDHTQFANRAAFDAALRDRIDSYAPDFVVLAGFMRILTDEFVTHYLGRMINIHPSLLPKYPGLHTHKRALEAGDKEAGATVHFVTPELDGGPLILQAKVPIETGDTELSLSKRVLASEHRLYPEVLAWLCSERLTFAEGLPILDGTPLQFPKLLPDT
ncbi:MAG: phosphoribosylglycinamide formyltransferase [Reinekea sp.]|nr:phosphoribosylglycinamide formyltransferase [Reinekea sp.]